MAGHFTGNNKCSLFASNILHAWTFQLGHGSQVTSRAPQGNSAGAILHRLDLWIKHSLFSTRSIVKLVFPDQFFLFVQNSEEQVKTFTSLRVQWIKPQQCNSARVFSGRGICFRFDNREENRHLVSKTPW